MKRMAVMIAGDFPEQLSMGSGPAHRKRASRNVDGNMGCQIKASGSPGIISQERPRLHQSSDQQSKSETTGR